jgi:hypothetical protein
MNKTTALLLFLLLVLLSPNTAIFTYILLGVGLLLLLLVIFGWMKAFKT